MFNIQFLDSITVYVACAFVFAGVYYAAITFFQNEETRSAKEVLGDIDKTKKASNSIIKYMRPLYGRYVLPLVVNMKIEKKRREYRTKLVAAGMLEEFTPDEFHAFKLLMIPVTPIFLAVANYAGDFGLAPFIYPLASVVGFYYPDILVSQAATARKKAVKRALPFVVDLLALSTEAGLDFMGAIGKVVEKAKPSPLVSELEQVLKELKIGSSRAEALKEFGVRINMSEVSSFVAILISADQMGASIGKVLRQQSEQIRIQRFLEGEKEGAKAGSKIMMPMFLFILPAIMITIFAPFVLSMMMNGGPGF